MVEDAVTEPGESHHSRAYDAALAHLRFRALEMGGLVCDQVTTAVRALLEYDQAAAELVLARERQINGYQTEIEAETFSFLARRSPVAGDLRTILAIGRAVTDLERAGDEAKKIARFAQRTVTRAGGDASIPVHRHLRHMAQVASQMLRRAVDAFDREDATVAHEVARMDRTLDTEFEAAMRQLVTVAMEHARLMRPTIDTVFALKSLERIGDHAKNIAEHVVFLVSGDDVRHYPRADAGSPEIDSTH